MRTLWQVTQAILGVAGLAGTVLCLAGVVGCWVLYAEAVRRTDHVFERVTNTLKGEHANLARACDQLNRTREELNAFRERDAEATAPVTPERTARRLKLRQTSDSATTKLTDTRRSVIAATEAALVTEGFLNALAEFPIAERAGVDVGSLREAADRLGDAARTAERLSDLLAPAAAEPAGDAVREQSSRLEELLGRITSAVETGANRLERARERVENARVRVFRVLTAAAVVLTVVLVWMGAGQASLMLRCLCRR